MLAVDFDALWRWVIKLQFQSLVFVTHCKLCQRDPNMFTVSDLAIDVALLYSSLNELCACVDSLI